VACGDQTMLARWAALLTLTDCTPGTWARACSTAKAQAAQCMPSTRTCDCQQV
jgi:hypothetical protein